MKKRTWGVKNNNSKIRIITVFPQNSSTHLEYFSTLGKKEIVKTTINHSRSMKERRKDERSPLPKKPK